MMPLAVQKDDTIESGKRRGMPPHSRRDGTGAALKTDL